jgi:hypothetical protein
VKQPEFLRTLDKTMRRHVIEAARERAALKVRFVNRTARRYAESFVSAFGQDDDD